MRVKLKPVGEQTIVITGASSGVGLATAREAVRRGASVVLVARNGEALGAIAEKLGDRAAACPLDIADDNAAERIEAAAVDAFGGIDTWVNCASVTAYGSLEQLGMTEQRRVFDVDYFAILQANLVAVRDFRARKTSGAIINVGSVLSDRAVIEQPAYCAAKAAVRALTDNLRMDVEREGLPISVTLIKPTGIHTPFPEHGRNHMDSPPRIPQPMYAPELVADAILFAAEHPRRQIYVGGAALIQSLVSTAFPRLTDRIMELVGPRAQKSPGHPGDPAARDNLFSPAKDGSVEGSQPFPSRQTSLFLQAQKHPLAASAILGTGALAAAAIARRRKLAPAE